MRTIFWIRDLLLLLLLYCCKLSWGWPLRLMTRLSELQFSPPVRIFMWEVHPGPSPQHSPGLSLSYARRGPPPNKQSTALRRHYPGLSLVTGWWYCPLIGWHQLTPSMSRRRRQKYEEQSPLWRNSGGFFPWKILKHNSPAATWQCFSCWH